MVDKIKVFFNYLSSENFALLQNFYIWKLTFYHFKTFHFSICVLNNFACLLCFYVITSEFAFFQK